MDIATLPARYRTNPCPECGGPVEVRSNRSRYCKPCYNTRYKQASCPRCGGKMSLAASRCSDCAAREFPPPRAMSEAEVAWLAGIVEGEGSMTSKTKTGLCVMMTDADIIVRLQAVTGVGRVTHNHWKAKEHYKDTSQWAVRRAADLAHLVPLIYPWLGARRRVQAEALLQRIGRLDVLPRLDSNQDQPVNSRPLRL